MIDILTYMSNVMNKYVGLKLFNLLDHFDLKYVEQDEDFKIVLYNIEQSQRFRNKLGSMYVSNRIKRDSGLYETEDTAYHKYTPSFFKLLFAFITDPSNKDTVKYASGFMPANLDDSERQTLLENLFSIALHDIEKRQNAYWLTDFFVVITMNVLEGSKMDPFRVRLVKDRLLQNCDLMKMKKTFDPIHEQKGSLKSIRNNATTTENTEGRDLNTTEILILKYINAFENDLLQDQEAEKMFQMLLTDGIHIIDHLPAHYRDMLELLCIRGNIKRTDGRNVAQDYSSKEPVNLKINEENYFFLSQALYESKNGIFLKSPFERDRKTTRAISDFISELKYNQNFVSLFDNEATFFWNSNTEEKKQPDNSPEGNLLVNQECFLFADVEFIDIYQMIKTIHPEVSLALMKSIIDEYNFCDTSIYSQLLNYKPTNLEKNVVPSSTSDYEFSNSNKLRKLADDYLNETKNLKKMNTDIQNRYAAYLDGTADEHSHLVEMAKLIVSIYRIHLKFLVMRLYNRPEFEIDYEDSSRTRLAVKSGGLGFTARLKMNFLLFAYRLYLSNDKIMQEKPSVIYFPTFKREQPFGIPESEILLRRLEKIMLGDIIQGPKKKPLYNFDVTNVGIDTIRDSFDSEHLLVLNQRKIPKIHLLYIDEMDNRNTPNYEYMSLFYKGETPQEIEKRVKHDDIFFFFIRTQKVLTDLCQNLTRSLLRSNFKVAIICDPAVDSKYNHRLNDTIGSAFPFYASFIEKKEYKSIKEPTPKSINIEMFGTNYKREDTRFHWRVEDVHRRYEQLKAKYRIN
jgi:hypothetical protein